MLRLEDIAIFVKTAETGSLSAAARALDCSPAVASAALARLEETLGVQLLLRTTRSARLSPAGETYLPYASEALRAIDGGKDAISGEHSALRGELRISSTSDFGRHSLLPWLNAFQERHPGVTLRVQLGDRLSDLFREPVDVAIRHGDLKDSSLVALPLAPENRRALVAAPSYLARHGAPTQPQDLRGHNCLQYTVNDRPYDRWQFTCAGKTQVISVTGNRIADDGEAVRQWALAGKGICYLSRLDVARDLQAGLLKILLPDWETEHAPLHFVCAHRAQFTPMITALRQHLLTCLQSLQPPSTP